MSSFSDWCEQGEEALATARQEAAEPKKYPRLADYDAPEASPAADPGSPAPQAAPRAAQRPVTQDPQERAASIESPERWDSLW